MINQIKKIKIKELEELLSLLKEKEELEHLNSMRSMVPYQKFSFIQKHITKRKEYREYRDSINNFLKENEKNGPERHKRIREIERKLMATGTYTREDIEKKMKNIEKAETCEELGMNPKEAVEILYENGIEPEFESYGQAFELAPEIVGRDPEFMKKAIREDLRFIKYDRTDNEDLYKEAIEIRLEALRKQKEGKDDYDSIDINLEIEELEKMKSELNNPKEVEDGKYKVPHKYMFEEIRMNMQEDKPGFYWYSSVDGVYDKEFGEELQGLYEDPNIIVGVHGRSENEETEHDIFTQGLKNSTQNADNALHRTVAYGKNLKFTTLLNYRIPYNGVEPETAIILTLPRKTLDKEEPVPIWGSNHKTGSENYILPRYVYGLYHSKRDGENRSIQRNEEKEQEDYKYLKYDYLSPKSGLYEINDHKDDKDAR